MKECSAQIFDALPIGTKIVIPGSRSGSYGNNALLSA